MCRQVQNQAPAVQIPNAPWWQGLRNIIEENREEFEQHIRLSNRPTEDHWDFKPARANCPHEVGIKVRANGNVEIYFSCDMARRENRDQDRPQHIIDFIQLLENNPFERENDRWERGNVRLKQVREIRFQLSHIQGDNIQNYPDYQYDACIELAELLEELYGRKEPPQQTARRAQRNGRNRQGLVNHQHDDAPHADDNPRQWGIFERLQGIQAYPVRDWLHELNEIGEHVVAYRPEGGGEYYLGMNNGRPTLNQDLPENQRVTLKQLVSWPMCARNEARRNFTRDERRAQIPNSTPHPEYTMKVNGENVPFTFPNGSGIEQPLLHPQFVFLGENCSTAGDAGNLNALWTNAYCVMAKIVLDSIFSGAFFTDFLKCFTSNHLTEEDREFLNSKVVLSNGTELDVNWYDVYMNIFLQELDLLNQFNPPPQPKYVFIVGQQAYNITTNVPRFIEILEEKGYEVRILGCHYSYRGKCRGDGNRLQSCRRVYRADDNGIKRRSLDFRRLDGADQRGYEFALIDIDGQGNLVPYNGNPNPD